MPLRQCFDHREDDPVRFSVLACPQTRLKYPQYRVPRPSGLPQNIHLLITSQDPPTLHQYPLRHSHFLLRPMVPQLLPLFSKTVVDKARKWNERIWETFVGSSMEAKFDLLVEMQV